MTPATLNAEERHDTLTPVTGRSGKGTARQTIRVDEDLWASFGAACEIVGLDRSAVLRAFMHWFARQPGAKMPKRPPVADAGGDTGGAASSEPLGESP